MITREFLLKEGFVKDPCSPEKVEDFYRKKKIGGYISVRFMKGQNEPCGLYAYFENEHDNIRKVVLSDTIVTEKDFEMAKKLSRFE